MINKTATANVTVFPLVHLNGTSKQALLDQLCGAHAALNDALEALREATPNGRDYYPLGSEAGFIAGSEHRDRVDRVNQLMEEIQLIIEKVDEQE